MILEMEEQFYSQRNPAVRKILVLLVLVVFFFFRNQSEKLSPFEINSGKHGGKPIHLNVPQHNSMGQ